MVWRKKNYCSGSLAIPASGRGRRSSLTACFPAGRIRHHAHRRRKKHVLPAPGADAAGNYPGNFAPDLPDAGSGDGAERGGRSRRVPEQHLTGPQMQAAYRNLLAGRYKIVYVAPERLDYPGFGGVVEKLNISFIAVDGSPLHFPVGTGFPPQLFENRAVYRQPSEAPGGWGVHRHRDPEACRRTWSGFWSCAVRCGRSRV